MSLKNDFLKNWADFRTEIEEFSLQFHLGKAEAKERLDEFKKTFSSDLETFDEKLDDLIKNGRPYLEDLKQEIDTFRVQIKLAKAENNAELDDYLQSVQQSYRNISAKFGERFEKDEELQAQWTTAREKISEQMSKMRGAIDGIKLQTALGELDAKVELEKFQKKAATKIDELNKISGVQWQEVDSKAQSLFEEIQTFFIKMKDEIFGKTKK